MSEQPTAAALPMITIVLQPRVVGAHGEYVFDAWVNIANMPGGWRTAHHGLCLALEQVLPVIEEEARGEGVVKLAHQLPNGNSLVR